MTETPATPSARRSFFVVVALEGLGVFVAVNLAANLHHPALTMPAIGLVVGLHFLPLAKIFRAPSYRLTGLALCGLAIGSAFIDGDARAVTLGLGAAAILWATMLVRTLGKPTLAAA